MIFGQKRLAKMTEQLFKIKPLKWHEAADGYWVASSENCTYEVEENIWTIKARINGHFILALNCKSISDGKARAEQHHLYSVSKDLIEVVTKRVINF